MASWLHNQTVYVRLQYTRHRGRAVERILRFSSPAEFYRKTWRWHIDNPNRNKRFLICEAF